MTSLESRSIPRVFSQAQRRMKKPKGGRRVQQLWRKRDEKGRFLSQLPLYSFFHFPNSSMGGTNNTFASPPLSLSPNPHISGRKRNQREGRAGKRKWRNHLISSPLFPLQSSPIHCRLRGPPLLPAIDSGGWVVALRSQELFFFPRPKKGKRKRDKGEISCPPLPHLFPFSSLPKVSLIRETACVRVSGKFLSTTPTFPIFPWPCPNACPPLHSHNHFVREDHYPPFSV